MTALESLTHARRNGVSPSAFHTLLAVFDSAEPILASVISAATGVSTAATTGMVDTLVAKGWLERVELPDDRRKRAVRPTRKAWATFVLSLPAPSASVATTENNASPVMGVKIAPDGAGNSQTKPKP